MKITETLIKRFEQDQKKSGTETAIFNLLWAQASEQLIDIGCKRIRTKK